MAYDFKVKHDVEIPEVVRARTSSLGLGLPFDAMKPGKGAGTAGSSFWLGRDFWKDRMSDADIDRKAGDGKNSGPTDIRNKVKNSFEGWKKKDEKKRKNLTLVIDDKFAKDGGKYEGCTVYLSTKLA